MVKGDDPEVKTLTLLTTQQSNLVVFPLPLYFFRNPVFDDI